MSPTPTDIERRVGSETTPTTEGRIRDLLRIPADGTGKDASLISPKLQQKEEHYDSTWTKLKIKIAKSKARKIAHLDNLGEALDVMAGSAGLVQAIVQVGERRSPPSIATHLI